LHRHTDVRVFISYPHQWQEEAVYIAQTFKTYGIQVWLDENQLRTGNKLNREITNAIASSNYFVPLLSPEYFASEWCIKEMEVAAYEDVAILPIKVTMDQLIFSPHIKRLYNEKLGEPVLLDLRGRNPSGKLKELATQIVAKQR
jgi:hypothetical protein